MALTNGTVDDNGNIYYPVGYEFKGDDFSELLHYYDSEQSPKYKDKINEYKGKTKAFADATNGALGANSAQGVVNYPKTLVDFLNGYFIGIPVTIGLEDDDDLEKTFQNWLAQTSFSDKLAELSKQTSVYGRSYMLAYNDEDSNLKITPISPEQAVMVYDDTIDRNPLMFVMYSQNSDKALVGHIYTQSEDISFIYDGQFSEQSSNLLPFSGNVPAVEFFDNEEKMGVFDPAIDLIHMYDKALSAKSDDNDYFAHAYLFLKNFKMDESEQIDIKKSRVISTQNDGISNIDVDAKFLEKPDADQLQEHLLDRLEDLIYRTTSVANMKDTNFGSSSSGVSLAYKLQPMSNLALNKERKFTQKLRELFKAIQGQLGIDYSQLTFKFIRNVPNNNATEATIAQQLMGITSHETALSTLSFISNPEQEMRKIREEDKQQIQNSVSNADYDFGKNNDVDTDKDSQ